MNTEHATPELFAALAVAQGKVENAAKGSKNSHFGSKYADLAEILNTVRPVFAAEGLALAQSTGFDGSRVIVTTLIAHKAGGFLTSDAACVPAKTDAQGVGAATTYLRRYSLAAMAGIAQEDDDGNAAAHSGQPTPITPTAGVWEALPEKRQAALLEMAGIVNEYIETGDPAGAWSYLTRVTLSTDEKAALWTRLDSKTRSAIKRAEKEAA